MHSPRTEDVHQAASADAKVDSRANEGEAEVVADTAVQLPALLDLLHPEHQQPAHDAEHADPDEELDPEVGHIDKIGICLLTTGDERPHRRTSPREDFKHQRVSR